ncbi:HNH endonuclease signature motif containing protein [Branchiibius cervicis]|uniref:DUF222 domain-containing protein n=1 Tax=Branchiibius cervicis TaxID=908252 RepID=A0ABW2AWD5_9MICO
MVLTAHQNDCAAAILDDIAVELMVAELHTLLDRFTAAGSWAGVSPDQARQASGRLASARARLDAVLMTAAARVRDAVTAAGGSPGQAGTLLANEFGGDRRETGVLLALHEQLSDRPATRGAFADGTLSKDQVAVIARGVSALPDSVRNADREAAERSLLDAAPELSLIDLRRRATRMREAFETAQEADAHEDAQLVDQEAAAWAKSSFWMKEVCPGQVRGGFLLPTAQGQMLKTALEAISAPRRFHLSDSSVVTSKSASSGHASPPTWAVDDTVRPPAADPKRSPGLTTPTDPASGDPRTALGRATAGEWARSGDQLDAELDEADRADAGGLPMDAAHREGRALAQLCEHLPLDALPGAGGVSAVMTVNLDYETLALGVRAATLSTGDRISAGEARRLACGAQLIPQVFDGASLPLDLGRAKRLFSTAQRRAAANKYGGCAFPGCEKPPEWCEGHHWRRPWATGGTTDLADLAPLCSSYHRRVHLEDIPIRFRDGHLEFSVQSRGRPAGERAWRRNRRYRVPPTEG